MHFTMSSIVTPASVADALMFSSAWRVWPWIPPSATPPPPGFVPSAPDRKMTSPTRTAVDSTPPGRALGGLMTCFWATAVLVAITDAATTCDVMSQHPTYPHCRPRLVKVR